MSGRAVAVPVALLALLGNACGGSGDAGGKAQEALAELQELEPGEILIKGATAPRVSGPWTLEPGGYRLRFEHARGSSAAAELRVSLARTRTQPAGTTLLIATSEPSGVRNVTLTGRVFVHIHRADGPYVLRLTPQADR